MPIILMNRIIADQYNFDYIWLIHAPQGISYNATCGSEQYYYNPRNNYTGIIKILLCSRRLKLRNNLPVNAQ